MKSRLFIFLLFAVSLATTQAQVIDTTKSINTWKLMHNYTRFEEMPLDTNMHQLHRNYHPAYQEGFGYENLGILGHGLNHVDFFLRPENDAFVFGTGWNPYLKTAARTLFFNTRSPFTTLAYSTNLFINQAPEENIDVLHTQNLSPYSNFGLEFNILSGKELYANEATRVNRVGLFGSHAKDRYSIFGTFYYNDFKAEDHAGLIDMDAFIADEADESWLYSMRLTEAKSQYRNLSFFATHKYNLFERTTSTDSLGITTTKGKTLSLSHQVLYDRHFKSYEDQVNLDSVSSIYDNYYYEVASAFDSVSEDKVTNVFQVILGDPDYDKISARVYAGHEFRRFGMLSPAPQTVFDRLDTITQIPLEVDSVYRDSVVARFNDTHFNDVYVGFHLAGPTTGTWDWVIDGKYYLLGYYQNDFRINATFSREFLQKADLGLRGSLELRRPHHFVNHYSSSFFTWENDFPSLLRMKGEAFVQSNEMEMELRAGVAYLSNYQYWDQQALPRIYNKDILIFSGYFSKHFVASGFNSDDKILVQYTTADDVLRLPAVSLYSSNYWRQSLFKGALITTIGFDLSYTTKYLASGYMPATGVFHLQDESDVGGYPFLDVFLAIKIARTRIFVSWNNLLSGGQFLGNNYFTTYRYPMKPRNLRLGLEWTFYD
ncbi:MAG: putative porin [Bacteroidetes bacterium]|nr:putative porin [Bacteroidota bacterium]